MTRIFHICALAASNPHRLRREKLAKTGGPAPEPSNLVSATPQVRHRYIQHRTIAKWKRKHFNIMSPYKRLGQQMIRTHLNIAIVPPVVITVNESKPTKPGRHHKVLKARIVGAIFLLITHACQQRDQLALAIHFFSKAYKRRICLFANATTAKSTATSPRILVFSTSSESYVRKLADMVPHLQLAPIVLNLVKASNFEKCRVPRDIFKQKGRGWRHKCCIAMKIVVKLLSRMVQYIPVIRRMQRMVPRSWNWKTIWSMT